MKDCNVLSNLKTLWNLFLLKDHQKYLSQIIAFNEHLISIITNYFKLLFFGYQYHNTSIAYPISNFITVYNQVYKSIRSINFHCKIFFSYMDKKIQYKKKI